VTWCSIHGNYNPTTDLSDCPRCVTTDATSEPDTDTHIHTPMRMIPEYEYKIMKKLITEVSHCHRCPTCKETAKDFLEIRKRDGE